MSDRHEEMAPSVHLLGRPVACLLVVCFLSSVATTAGQTADKDCHGPAMLDTFKSEYYASNGLVYTDNSMNSPLKAGTIKSVHFRSVRPGEISFAVFKPDNTFGGSLQSLLARKWYNITEAAGEHSIDVDFEVSRNDRIGFIFEGSGIVPIGYKNIVGSYSGFTTTQDNAPINEGNSISFELGLPQRFGLQFCYNKDENTGKENEKVSPTTTPVTTTVSDISINPTAETSQKSTVASSTTNNPSINPTIKAAETTISASSTLHPQTSEQSTKSALPSLNPTVKAPEVTAKTPIVTTLPSSPAPTTPFTRVQPANTCGGVFTKESGIVTFSSGGGQGQSCWYTVAAPTGILRITVFFVYRGSRRRSSNCTTDYLEIRDGTRSGPVLRRVCTTTLVSFVTSGKMASLLLVTSGRTNAVTLQMKYERWACELAGGQCQSSCRYGKLNAVCGRGLACCKPKPCGGIFNNTSGVLTSPNYPRSYDGNKTCVYVVNVTFGVLQLKVEALDIEVSRGCTFDSLTIHDGSIFGPVLKRMCGTHAQKTIMATGSTAYLVFVSDAEQQGSGFRLSYSRQTCEEAGGRCNVTCQHGAFPGRTCSGSDVCCQPSTVFPNCGVPPVQEHLIVGGREAQEHRWPWQVRSRGSGGQEESSDSGGR